LLSVEWKLRKKAAFTVEGVAVLDDMAKGVTDLTDVGDQPVADQIVRVGEHKKSFAIAKAVVEKSMPPTDEIAVKLPPILPDRDVRKIQELKPVIDRYSHVRPACAGDDDAEVRISLIEDRPKRGVEVVDYDIPLIGR
jgi:hypothetical protein